MGCCSTFKGLVAGSVVGGLVAVMGIILIPLGDMLIGSTVKKEGVIEPGTTAYENWVSAGAPVYRQFWLYNVLNPDDVVNNGSIPQVQEQGPYTYRTRYLPKENITFDLNTVSFVLPAGAIFEPTMSVGPEEDNVTVLNLVVAGSLTVVPKPLHNLVNFLIKNTKSSLFMTRTVKEVLWGYRDPILNDVTGVFYPYNNTFDGPYNISTGKDDISKVSLINSWQDSSLLPFWDDPYCNMLNGSDASSFPPFVEKKKPLYFFSSDICRSVSAAYSSTHNLKGIDVYRYMLTPNTLASPNVNPDNMCYCRDMEVTKNCSMAGVLDVSACRDGYPIYISLPHFLYGSPELNQAIQGMSPHEEHHATYLDVEPITGFTLRFAKRIQMNMMYGPSDKITVLNKVKDFTIFPVVWLNETAMLDDATADMFKEELVSKVNLLDTMQISLISVGIIACVVLGIAACVVHRNDERKIVA
ncbi:platelet glycoprotein 4 [Engraulis encrasicolus]|uniref:platelet glycoprotein 4 n=1 Tax=Engraulis encrasicolus TaxID=184585 RepID=UPI002FD4705C